MTGPVKSPLKDTNALWGNTDYVPILEEVAPAADTEMGQYHKMLRQYFLREQKTSESLQINVAPVLLAPFLRGEKPRMDLPALYDHKSHEVTSLLCVLQEMFTDLFSPGEADMLAQSLPRIASIIQENLTGQDQDANYDFQVREAVKELRQKVHQGDTEVFQKQCDQFEAHLLSRKATLIEFSSLSVFQMLNLQLKKRNEHNNDFLNTLKKSIAGLNEILLLQSDDSGPPQSHYDFAGELISFDKISDMALPVVSSGLPEARLNRLQDCLNTLSQAQKSYSNIASTIFITYRLVEQFGLKKTLSEATLEITSEDSCAKALSYYKKEISEFVKIIAALRLAELEINQEYDENLHAPYFEGFDLSYLSDDDIQYFRSLIVVEESLQLTQQPKDFLALISDSAPIKVLAVNWLDEKNVTNGHTDDEDTHLELAALAIFRRNAYIFQGATHTPSSLNEAFQKGLDSAYPALWNVLFTEPGAKWGNADLLALKTAIDSRYFPSIEYDIRLGDDFGSHFDISGNPQPERSFPSFNQEVKSPSGKQVIEYSLTMADYLALSPDNQGILEIVPLGYGSEDLVPLDEYLNLSHDSLAGKMPFIWMVDEQNMLKQAVINISWLRRCRARMEYWRFLQELGGAASSHIKDAVEEAKSEWEAIKEAEIANLKTQLNAEFESTRNDDLSKAISRMLNAFLSTDDQITALLKPSANTPITSQEQSKIEPETKQVQKDEDVTVTISSEAWIESDDCTSCNDCIDALPGVFKYNSDKQAIVHNPKGGTYAKIVASAEKCPAACIHPGLPHNSGEPGLERLIERAEKFN